MDSAKPKRTPNICVLFLWLTLGFAYGGRDQFLTLNLPSAHRSLTVSDDADERQTIIPDTTQADRKEADSELQSDAASLRGIDGRSSSESLSLQPSACPGNCTKFGTCHEELGRCDCPMGRTGADCSTVQSYQELHQLCIKHGHTNATCGREVDPPLCINACNFRGRCIGGFCHCRPGFFGSDCSLSIAPTSSIYPNSSSSNAAFAAAFSGAVTEGRPNVKVLAGQDYQLRASGPRIYVYELPPDLNVYGNLERLDRPLMYLLWQRILSAGLRVADPMQADFFFVPVRVRMSYDSERLITALLYIRQTWPYWNATGGARHVLIHTGDWGRDDMSDDVQLLTRNSTWLTHWGLAREHEFAGWAQAHRPGRDIVLPLMLQASVVSHYRLSMPTDATGRHPAPRTRTLFFAGRVCGSRAQPSINGTYPNCPDVLGKEDAYSAATRQRVYFFHHNRTNWKVVTKTRSYAADMATSRFCLAPSGAGQGKRSILSVLLGCVPVTVTDGLMQPFEPEMRWEKFAIDVRERDIPIMHELLERLRPEQLSEFQSHLRCAGQHLFWSSLYGSAFGEDGRYDAFETLVQVLRMRATYPTLGPEEYEYVDPAYAAFMACRDPTTATAAASMEGSSLAAAGGSGQQLQPQPDGAVFASGAALLHGNLSAGVGGGDGGSGWGDPAKPELHKVLAGSSSRAVPQPRYLSSDGRSVLCSHSRLSVGGASSCSKCVRRRGRLLNPGGTICCNTRELAKCPRLWD